MLGTLDFQGLKLWVTFNFCSDADMAVDVLVRLIQLTKHSQHL